MNKRLHFLIVLHLVFSCPLASYAQLSNADLTIITPSVAKVGTTETLSFSGNHLDNVTTLRFSDARIKLTPEMLLADEYYPTARAHKNYFLRGQTRSQTRHTKK